MFHLRPHKESLYGLHLLITFLEVLAFVVFLVGILGALSYGIAASMNWKFAILLGLGSFITALVLWGLAELLELLVKIEANTRPTGLKAILTRKK
jgi:hypothetical protein